MVTVVPAAEVVTACLASSPASSAPTILLPRLPLVGQSKPSGRPMPSSATWMRTTPPLSRWTRVSTSPLSRPTKAWRKALVRISETSRPTRPAVSASTDHLLGDDVDADALAAVEVADRGGDAADVGAERHLVAEGRGDAGLAQLLVEELERLDAAGHDDVVVARRRRLRACRRIMLTIIARWFFTRCWTSASCICTASAGSRRSRCRRRSGCRGSRRRGPRRGIGVIVRRLRKGVPSARWLVISMAMSSPAATAARMRATRVGLGRRPLQEAAVAADHRLDGVAGQPGEGGVGVDDRVVLEGRVGQDTSASGRPESAVVGSCAGRWSTLASAHAARTVRCSMRFSCGPWMMRWTKMPGVWMPSGSRLPSGTISSTSATQTRPQVAAFGLKLRAVLR